MCNVSINSIKCIACGYEIKRLDKSLSEIPEDGMWDGGEVTRISMGYGSRLDGNIHIIGICDICVDKGMRNGSAYYLGDYMFPKDIVEYSPLKQAE